MGSWGAEEHHNFGGIEIPPIHTASPTWVQLSKELISNWASNHAALRQAVWRRPAGVEPRSILLYLLIKCLGPGPAKLVACALIPPRPPQERALGSDLLLVGRPAALDRGRFRKIEATSCVFTPGRLRISLRYFIGCMLAPLRGLRSWAYPDLGTAKRPVSGIYP